MQRNPQLP
uniref:Uncharacterized protein n=1 Tax=Rhizophora mucronata TaxID=61149 RepID=A0A2P2P756_RHIMU